MAQILRIFLDQLQYFRIKVVTIKMAEVLILPLQIKTKQLFQF